MRLGLIAVVVSIGALSSGCGYVGPVVPPSPMLPVPVSDLSVVERGDKLYIVFSAPAITTDAQSIKHFSGIELRMGPDPAPFNMEEWESTSRRYDVVSPPDAEEDTPMAALIRKTIPVSEWQGKTISVAVRTAIKGDEHFSAWSNRVTFQVVPPLQPPQVKAEATKEGYRLTWLAERPGLHYQVLRSSPTEKAPIPIGIAEKPEYVDGTSQWATPYEYSVIAQYGPSIESLPSAPIPANARDNFAPTVPTDVTALAAPDSVEISWTRSPESDLKGYLVYRSLNNGPFTVVGELTPLPTFSDRKAEHGRTYKYAITAIDNSNNESEKSQPVEVTF